MNVPKGEERQRKKTRCLNTAFSEIERCHAEWVKMEKEARVGCLKGQGKRQNRKE